MLSPLLVFLASLLLTVRCDEKLDQDLIQHLHNGSRNLLGIGMLTPTRIVVIVDQYFPKYNPSNIGFPPPGCCNISDYYVFDCEVPPATAEQFNSLNRTFPLYGAELLQTKWSNMYGYLIGYFANKVKKNLWPRFFIVQANDTVKTNFLLVYTMDEIISDDAPQFAMNMTSLEVSKLPGKWWEMFYFSPISSVNATMFGQEASYHNAFDGTWYRYEPGDDFHDPGNMSVANRTGKWLGCVSIDNNTVYMKKPDGVCPKPNEFRPLLYPYQSAFSDNITGIYLFDWFATKTWAMGVNVFSEPKGVRFRDTIKLADMLLLGPLPNATGGNGTEYYTNYDGNSTGTDDSTDTGSNPAAITVPILLIIIVGVAVAIYCCCCRGGSAKSESKNSAAPKQELFDVPSERFSDLKMPGSGSDTMLTKLSDGGPAQPTSTRAPTMMVSRKKKKKSGGGKPKTKGGKQSTVISRGTKVGPKVSSNSGDSEVESKKIRSTSKKKSKKSSRGRPSSKRSRSKKTTLSKRKKKRSSSAKSSNRNSKKRGSSKQSKSKKRSKKSKGSKK